MQWLIFAAFLVIQIFSADAEKAYRIQFDEGGSVKRKGFSTFADNNKLDVWRMNNDEAVVRAPDSLESSLKAKFNARVVVKDVAKAVAASLKENEDTKNRYKRRRVGSSSTTFRAFFHNYDEVYDWMKALAAGNSFVTFTNFGGTYEHNNMALLRISLSNGTKPAIFILAGLHAREWLATASAQYVLYETVTKIKANDSRIMALLRKYDIYAVPVGNPDGYNYTFSGPDARMWRKTRRPIQGNCTGADPNRNFDIHHGEQPAKQLLPCHEAYPGSSAFSELCTSSIRTYVNNLKLIHRVQIKLFYDLHTWGQLYLVPYAYDMDVEPPDDAEVRRVANISKTALKTINGRDFLLGTSGDFLSNCPGSAMDWFKVVAHVKYSYSLELFPEFDNYEINFIARPGDIVKSGKEVWEAIVSAAEAIP